MSRGRLGWSAGFEGQLELLPNSNWCQRWRERKARWYRDHDGAPHLDTCRYTSTAPVATGGRLGDRASRACWAHACYLLDYTYLACPERDSGVLRYRSGFGKLCAQETRRLPLFLDSAAYREATGTAPAWSSYQRYCEAIDLVRPDGAMARDVLDDREASRLGLRASLRRWIWSPRHSGVAGAPGLGSDV